MADTEKSSAIEDSKFKKVVEHFLKTPPKPHKEMKHKDGEKEGSGRRRLKDTS